MLAIPAAPPLRLLRVELPLERINRLVHTDVAILDGDGFQVIWCWAARLAAGSVICRFTRGQLIGFGENPNFVAGILDDQKSLSGAAHRV